MENQTENQIPTKDSIVDNIKQIREQAERLEVNIKKLKDERDANSHNYACYQEAKAEIDEKNAHISYLEDMLRQIANIVEVYQGHKRAESIALKHEEDKTEPLSRIEKCPICGKTVLDFTERFNDREFGSFFINCELCGATTNEYDTPEAALKAWNTGDVYDPNKVIER